jgi:hypothetical protein
MSFERTSRIATDAVESGGIGIIVPISGNHVFPLVAHPRLWISAASTPLAYHARSMALSFLRVGSGIKPEMLGERQPYPIRRPRIVAVLLMAYFLTHPAHVVGVTLSNGCG